jgi:hypothetical protein
MSECWRRGKRGWPGSFPVAQLPNAPLLVALGGWLVAAATHGSIHAYARSLFYAGPPQRISLSVLTGWLSSFVAGPDGDDGEELEHGAGGLSAA